MFPDWHDPIDAPTVGDDVTIVSQSIIIVHPIGMRAGSFKVSVQPRTAKGILSEHGRAIAALLQSTHDDTARFLDRYLRSNIELSEIDRLRVDLKNILENFRSALEYTAHHIAEMCNPKPQIVYLPIANLSDTEAMFARKLDKWFPGLSTSAPKVRDYLISIQEFSGYPWLRQLADLTNFNKHQSLSGQEIRDFHSVVVKFGDVGVRLGELGFRSLSIETGGVLRFVNSSEQQVDLNGPCVLDANTTSLAGADPRIEIVIEKHKLYRIPGYKESIAGALWSIDKNVFRAVHDICALLS